MRVFYDGYTYRAQEAGGVNRYFADLIGALPPDMRPILTCDSVRKHNFPVHPRLRTFQGHRQRPGYVARRLLALYFRMVTRVVPFDVAHPTYYSLLTRLPLSAYRRPLVVTVYDMIDELFPAQTDPTGVAARLKRQAVGSAQAIICISENTRQDLLRLFPAADERTHVIPLAAGFDRQASYGPEPVPERPFFLYVGQRDGYKNFAALRTAFAQIAPRRPEAVLCVVGPAFTEAESGLLSEAGVLSRIRHYGRVCDAHLAKLYRCCMAFVYPSLYEGFGLPVLEAMACGAAVIAGDRASIPEVAGDAALLLDPENSDDLADALQLLLDDEGERGRLGAAGMERAGRFSWRDTAARTAAVYRAVGR